MFLYPEQCLKQLSLGNQLINYMQKKRKEKLKENLLFCPRYYCEFKLILVEKRIYSIKHILINRDL